MLPSDAMTTSKKGGMEVSNNSVTKTASEAAGKSVAAINAEMKSPASAVIIVFSINISS